MYLTRVLAPVILAAVLLAGCAAGQPKDPNNICYILKEHKGCLLYTSPSPRD